MTYTYIINIVAPITAISDKLVSYNKYPIICISKKDIEQVLTNQQIIDSIMNTLTMIGTTLYDRTSIHIRTIDNNAKITDTEEPIKKYIERWK